MNPYCGDLKNVQFNVSQQLNYNKGILLFMQLLEFYILYVYCMCVSCMNFTHLQDM